MSDDSAKPEPEEQPAKQPGKPAPRTKYMMRYPTTSSTLVILETDVMRTGIEAKLLELSAARLKLRLDVGMSVGEHVKITLSNEIQRLRKETRGVIRDIEAVPADTAEADEPAADNAADDAGDDRCIADIELLVRLTPLEVMLLRMAIRNADDRPRWI